MLNAVRRRGLIRAFDACNLSRGRNKMNMRTLKLFLATLLLSVCCFDGLIGQAAYTYKCRKLGSPRQELEKADVVFIGKVTKISDNSSVRINEFDVEKIWKGPSTKRMIVSTGKHLYGYRFTEGEKYLVYASGTDELETSRCSRTKSLETASLDLKELGEGTVPE
jgi:hypothetical protein